MNPSPDAIVACGCLLIAVLLAIHFFSYKPAKKAQVSGLTRLEARYLEPWVYRQQKLELAEAEKEAEIALRKGLIDEFEDTVSGSQ